MNYKQLLTSLLAASTVLCGWALPARRGFVKVMGPDGDSIVVQRVGNAFDHNVIDADGNVMLRKHDGSFGFATLSQAGRMIETNTPVKLTDFRRMRSSSPMRRSAARSVPGKIGTFPGTSFPAKGKQKAIVVLVQFKDKKFELGDHAHDYFTNMLNKDDFSEYGATGGVHKYFMDVSNGQFDCQFDLYGPVTLKNNLEYYGANDSITGSDKHPEEMVVEACQQLNATVDFSQYDRDNDGVIDNVYVIYAGRGEASDVMGTHPELVWPHSWNVAHLQLMFDGKLLATYGCSNEWEDVFEFDGQYIRVVGENPDGIGTFVHEFSHILGLPDLYYTGDYDNDAYVTPGEWSVLDYGPYNNNGRTPPSYSAFERNALGWIDLTELTAESGDVTIRELNEFNEAYSITNPQNSGEFFLLESRQRKGWDAYLPGDGMLVWHVDYDADIWNDNSVNNVNSHQRVDLVEADGIADKSVRTGSDPFPGTQNVTSWLPKWWSNGYAGINLVHIAANSGTVTFTASSTTSGGSSTEAGDYYTVNDIIYSPMDDAPVTVRGYIVGYVANSPFQNYCMFTTSGCKVNTNIILADDPSERDPYQLIPVALPATVRKALNLMDKPENLGRYVELKGTRSKYFGEPGMKNVKSYKFIEQEQDSIEEINTPNAPSQAIYDLQGRRVSKTSRPGLYIINGVKTLVK